MLNAVAVTRFGRGKWNIQNLGYLRKGTLAVQMQTNNLALLVG